MKIAVTGTRGFPSIQGGVETHCKELYSRLSTYENTEIIVFGRKYYSPPEKPKSYGGVRLKWLPTVISPKFETLCHTFLSILHAKKEGADIMHIHACGSGLLVPLAKILGMKVVFTHHGEDYKREKWGKTARRVLKQGEKTAVRYADSLICVSPHIGKTISEEYGKTAKILPNGINCNPKTSRMDEIKKFTADREKYILAVGRIDPGKGFHYLIEAYRQAGLLKENVGLIIVGGSEHASDYSENLKKLAEENGVIMTGSLPSEDVMALMDGACLYVLPSTHEGHPISLLEAMSMNKDILASDIPSCRLPQLTENDFFAPGDIDSLSEALIRKVNHPATRTYDLSEYDWDKIAAETHRIYRELMLTLQS
ncbi:MAG: glycosyltransferase family 4 protein [Paramuribaculum sp.]|nr:glycosyltransferase family 4 protein [Paramuribaculum sp.]